MSQSYPSEVSLSGLVRRSPLIIEVRAYGLAVTHKKIHIHATDKQCPPFEFPVEHYSVVSVLKGKKIKSNDLVDVLPEDIEQKLERHKAYYLFGLAISSQYEIYKGSLFNEDAESKIIFIEPREDGYYEYVMYGAYERLEQLGHIKEIIAQHKKEDADNGVIYHPVGWSNPDDLLLHNDLFQDSPFGPIKNTADDPLHSATILVEPHTYKENRIIQDALRVADDFEGIKLYAPRKVTLAERSFNIAGIFQLYVSCGSQLSVWSLFPRAIDIRVTDILSGETYQSVDYSTMNVSWTSETVSGCADKPCDQIVGEYFTFDLFRQVGDLPLCATILEIRAAYFGKESEPVQVDISVVETGQHYL